METKVNFNALSAIENIYKNAKDSLLREELFNNSKNDIKKLSGYLETTSEESVIFAVAFVEWFEWHDKSEMKKVFRHFGLQDFHVLKYHKQIENLMAKKLLINKDNGKKVISRYDILKSTINAITKNEPVQKFELENEKKASTIIDLLEEFDEISDSYDNEDMEMCEFATYINNLINENQKYPLFQEVKRLRLSVFESFFLIDTTWDAIKSGDNDFNTNVFRTIDDYFKHKSTAINIIHEIVKKRNKLTKLGLIELSKETYSSNLRAKLSDKMIQFLDEKENLKIDNIAEDNKQLIYHQKIHSKPLFYGVSEIQQISTLENALHEESFINLQKRLEKQGLPKGISVLLHGEPGTGKTETVYQLAKKNERNIFKVDISETKSAWFGESQKLIKKVFRDYQSLIKKEKKCPILLFNEADAIISKRKTFKTNVSDTENAIQNIILEELENFEGLFFATTNLVKNMDDAFERRFLFKVKFEKPNIETLHKIWQNKLPTLKEFEIKQLAQRFPFSGGEIDNIVRKSMIEELLNDQKPNLESIIQMCENEKWQSNQAAKGIGFGK